MIPLPTPGKDVLTMSETVGHTPGPWTSGWGSGLTGPTTTSVAGATVAGKSLATFPVSKHGETIAICPDQVVGGKETGEANARLIAAAPDLLEALRKIMSRHASSVLFHDQSLADAANDAITKATRTQQ